MRDRGHRTTEAERREMIARYRAGETVYEVGEATGFSHMTVWRVLRRTGVETRRPGPRAAVRA